MKITTSRSHFSYNFITRRMRDDLWRWFYLIREKKAAFILKAALRSNLIKYLISRVSFPKIVVSRTGKVFYQRVNMKFSRSFIGIDLVITMVMYKWVHISVGWTIRRNCTAIDNWDRLKVRYCYQVLKVFKKFIARNQRRNARGV